MFENLFRTDPGVPTISPLTVLAGIVGAFILSLVIAWVYKKSHKGLSYSQSFIVALVLMGTLVAVVMLIIGTSVARAFTLFGAFTLIRFRTAVKDTRDIAFVFWALVTGLAVGTGNIVIAVIETAVVSLIVFALTKINFGSIANFDAILTIVSDVSRGATGNYKSVFDRYLKRTNLLNAASRTANTKMELSFHVQLLRWEEMTAFLNELRSVPGIEEVNLITAKGDIEY